MNMDFLVESLTPETLAIVQEELKTKYGDKEIKLADLTTGKYVDKAKYDTAIADLETSKKELDERTKDLEKLGDIDGLTEAHKAELAKIKADHETKEADYASKLAQNEFNSIVDLAIVQSGTIDAVGVKAHLQSSLKDLKVVDGKVDGLDGLISNIKETHKHYYPVEGAGGGGIATKVPSTNARDSALGKSGFDVVSKK